MNPRSLSFRLVLWYSLWLGVVFLATGALIYLALGHYLEKNLADSQLARARRVAALVARLGPAPARGYAADITADFAPEASDRFIRITRSTGEVVYQSGPPPDQSFDPAQISPNPGQPGVRRQKLAGGPELVLATVASETTPPLWVEAATPT